MIFRHAPLHLKFSSLSYIILCSLALLILFSTNNIIKKTLTKELQQDTSQLALALNDKAEFIILFESQAHMDELEATLANFSFIQSSIIKDLKGRVVFEYQKHDALYSGNTLKISSLIIPPDELSNFGLKKEYDRKDVIGSMIINVSTTRLEEIQKSILKNIAIICVLFLILVSITHFIASQQLLKPLYGMIQIMQKCISDSKFTAKATIGPTKEFAEIAIAYNAMTEHINIMTLDLDKTNQNLKQEIQEKINSFKHQQKLEEQLSQAQKLEAIGRMTAAIAHDFNNILGGILGFARLADQEIDSLQLKNSNHQSIDLADIKDSVDEIQLGGQRAQGIIRQLLIFSRKAKSEPQAVNLDDFVQGLLPFIVASIPANLQIQVAINPDHWIFIDLIQLEQIIINLVLNAKDASTQGGMLRISSRIQGPTDLICASCKNSINIDGDGDTLIIDVQDSGSGIDPKILNQIFDPFFSTKDLNSGSGMGLSIIHGLVHKNHGHISIISVKNQSTTFSLHFPLAQAQPNEKVEKTKKMVHYSEKKSTLNPILLVDDNEQLLKFMRLFLMNNGYKVEAFSSPTKALTTFIENKGAYLAVVSDYSMPIISGKDLGNAMIRYKQDTQLIICSGYNDSMHENNPHNPSALYLTKPIDHELLLKHLEKIVQIQHFSAN